MCWPDGYVSFNPEPFDLLYGIAAADGVFLREGVSR